MAAASGLAVASAATQGQSTTGSSGGGFMKFVKDCGTCRRRVDALFMMSSIPIRMGVLGVG